jgi:hypothetical protein
VPLPRSASLRAGFVERRVRRQIRHTAGVIDLRDLVEVVVAVHVRPHAATIDHLHVQAVAHVIIRVGILMLPVVRAVVNV